MLASPICLEEHNDNYDNDDDDVVVKGLQKRQKSEIKEQDLENKSFVLHI